MRPARRPAEYTNKGKNMFFRKKVQIREDIRPLRLKHSSILACPSCGFKRIAAIPTPASSYKFECSRCHSVNLPANGDDCVFCSYGSVKCPEKQLAG